MSASQRSRYRFGPRDRRGLIAGARTAQVLVASAGLTVAVVIVRAVRGTAGGTGAFVAVAAALAGAFWPVHGRTLDEWVPVAARFASDAARGRRRAVVGRGSPSRDPRPPGPFGHLALCEVTSSAIGGAFGAVRDSRGGAWTAVLSLGSDSFALLDEDDRARRIAAWSGVLAAVSGESSALHRLQWVERTLPDRGEVLRRHLESRRMGAPPDPGTAAARRSYEELLEDEGTGVLRHELFLACTVRAPRSAERVLGEEVARLERRCRDAAIPVDGVLSLAGLSTLVRRTFDEVPGSGPAAWPWPSAVDASWSALRTDGTWHATYWIAEWPRSDVASDFLLPLLVGCPERRSVSVVMASVPPTRAIRAAEHARTSTAADADLRRRHGFATSARRHREHEAVVRREGELAEGHAAYRFSGYVTVTVPDPAALDGACSRVEQSAALARVELRRLYGAQGEAVTFTLPTGRGCA
ncbi:MAG TPA: SCO6880 family protein [Acidimicrobiales bacterium]|nr:SCO6880 family protein [Acidimicrobiales bacterium]